MHLMVFGMNHKSSPISIRENLVYNSEAHDQVVKELLTKYGVHEACVISTCNRTEIYLVANNPQGFLRWLYKVTKCDLQEIRKYTYVFYAKDAVCHLYRVACGLDSLVLGEAEILGQIKNAYTSFDNINLIGKTLNKLFQSTFCVAKKVRTNTRIGVNPVSVAYIGAQLTSNLFTNFNTLVGLVIGAGQTSKLVIKHLYTLGLRKIYIANRTKSRSLSVIDELSLNDLDVQIISLSEIPDTLCRVDMVVSSTASTLPLIGKGMCERALKVRKHRPMFLLDLAVPRDIEPEISELSDVFLYCIDDLECIAKVNQESRQIAANSANIIVDVEADEFMNWMHARDSFSIISDYRQYCANIKQQSLNEAVKQLRAGRDAEDVLERLAHVMLNRVMHQPTINLRKAGSQGNQDILTIAKGIFLNKK